MIEYTEASISMTTIKSLLSNQVASLESLVERYKNEYAALWWDTSAELPALGRTYSASEQKKTEQKLTLFIDEHTLKIKQYPAEKELQKKWLKEFTASLKESGQQMSLPDEYLNSVFNQGFIDSTRHFIERVKEFDPALKIEDVYQALRNVWIMNSLQIYFSKEIEYTNAIFGYSMLYPYTDNRLDDEAETWQSKYELLKGLKFCLEGRPKPDLNTQEERLSRLINMIEDQYDRQKYPGVFQSLLAIFNAQIKSLSQQKAIHVPYETDILKISLEKGGTSVLADGFLVNGILDLKQSDFCFGFGLFLQLADDIQDVKEDRKNNHMTLFSQTAGRYELDRLANKLFNFIACIVNTKLDSNRKNEKSLQELITKNCFLLILEAIGKNKAFYSKEYYTCLQPFFPIRFSFLKTLRKKIQKNFLENNRNLLDYDLVSTILLTITSRTISNR